MLSGERNYYRQRIDQELAAAERALSPQARLAHRELADRYSSRLELLEFISSVRDALSCDGAIDGNQVSYAPLIPPPLG